MASKHRARRLRSAVLWIVSALAVWAVVAYLALPWWWRSREVRHPALDAAPTMTTTADGHPGDPLNLIVIATGEELSAALSDAGWHRADPVSVGSGLRIVEDTAFHRPYADAPVSPLLLFGRRQDLAFEKPVGPDPRERHHVRFWQAPATDASGRPAWWGAATFDRSVGFSHTTGEITHHISPDVDAERELLLGDLQSRGFSIRRLPDFQQKSGKNGGGDPWRSDGALGIAEKK